MKTSLEVVRVHVEEQASVVALVVPGRKGEKGHYFFTTVVDRDSSKWGQCDPILLMKAQEMFMYTYSSYKFCPTLYTDFFDTMTPHTPCTYIDRL